MNKVLISTVIIFLFFGNISSAQSTSACPVAYLGFSTGLENPTGIIGFNLDVPIKQSFSVAGGAGIGFWGLKLSTEGRYYFSPCNRGLALGAGITHSAGIRYDDIYCKPVTNIFASGYRFWSLGKNKNRFHIQGGYSFRLTSDLYHQDGDSRTSNEASELLAPGGLIAAIGFSFRLD